MDLSQRWNKTCNSYRGNRSGGGSEPPHGNAHWGGKDPCTVRRKKVMKNTTNVWKAKGSCPGGKKMKIKATPNIGEALQRALWTLDSHHTSCESLGKESCALGSHFSVFSALEIWDEEHFVHALDYYMWALSHFSPLRVVPLQEKLTPLIRQKGTVSFCTTELYFF